MLGYWLVRDYLIKQGSTASLGRIMDVSAYLYVEVLAQLEPEVFPHKHIAVGMIKCLVASVLMSGCPDAQVGNAGGIGAIISCVKEELVAGENRNLARFAAAEEVYS